ncbi:MAG: protein kinase family protein [Turicibacter sp.]
MKDNYYKLNQTVNGYSITKILGEGRYGIAYLATNKLPQEVVIKQLKIKMLEETRKKLFYEENILLSLNHPSIPKFMGKFQDDSREGYILEYIEGRVFEDLLIKDGYVFNKDEIYNIASQLLGIIEFIHDKNVVHRDIRLPNVILKENKELALIDFGLARYIDNDRYVKETDYWFLGDFLIHLYYTSYEGVGRDERPWYDELDLYPEELRFLKKLMSIDESYKNINEIKNDLQDIKAINKNKLRSQKRGGSRVIKEVDIQKVHIKSFRANLYNVEPFRMIGLIDVNIQYSYGLERVTVPFYRSSGTNNGKIKGLWYPIVGIKTQTGPFTEFTDYLNHALTTSTKKGIAKKGWLAKSIFFTDEFVAKSLVRGFSTGKHYEPLLEIGKTLRILYEKENYYDMYTLDPEMLNTIVTADEIYKGNTHTQRENYNNLMADIINGIK